MIRCRAKNPETCSLMPRFAGGAAFSGKALGISALLKVDFPDPRWTGFIVVALVFLLLTVVAAVFAMLYALNLRVPPAKLETEGDYEDRLFARRAYYRLALFAPRSFVIAIFCLTAFAIRNAF